MRLALIWRANGFGYIPNSKVADSKIAVYLGKLEGKVVPYDLPAIAFMDIQMMLHIGFERLPVEAVISSGTDMRQREPIPRNTLLELVGRQKEFYNLYSTHREVAESIIAELQFMLKSN